LFYRFEELVAQLYALYIKINFLTPASYSAAARLAHVAGLETHIGSVFRKGFLL